MPEITVSTDEVLDEGAAPEGAEEQPNGDVTIPDDGDSAEPKASEEAPRKFAGKFDSPEALEEAYQNLQKKLGERGGEKDAADAEQRDTGKINLDAEEAADEAEKQGFDLDSLVAELSENGELSDEAYEKAEKAGMSRAHVDAFVRGQQALADELVNGLAEVVGGRDEMKSILDWAKTGLPREEAVAYNEAVEAGNTGLARALLRGMHAAYVAAEGSEPSLVEGENVPQTKGVKPFGSVQEIHKAMADRRYRIGPDRDPKYVAEVERRMAVTDIF